MCVDIQNPQNTNSGGRFPAEYLVLVRGDKMAGGASSEEGGSGMFISLGEVPGSCCLGNWENARWGH